MLVFGLEKIFGSTKSHRLLRSFAVGTVMLRMRTAHALFLLFLVWHYSETSSRKVLSCLLTVVSL
jgi:hypothetical protein